jgi:hypothetical protein
MATVAVTDVIQGTDAYLTRSKTANSTTTGDIYTYPIDQNYIKLTNGGDYDLLINVGKYTNITIHPGDSFEAFTDFASFDIKSFGGVSAFTVVSKELGTTPVDTITTLWKYLKVRDNADDGDMVLTASNLTSSAATINTAITGAAKKHETEFTVTIKNAAGSATHEWFNGNMPVSVAKTSTAGVVAISGGLEYITFVEGVGKIKVVMTGTWAQNDVVKLTVAANDVMGFTVAKKDVTDTLGA